MYDEYTKTAVSCNRGSENKKKYTGVYVRLCLQHVLHKHQVEVQSEVTLIVMRRYIRYAILMTSVIRAAKQLLWC